MPISASGINVSTSGKREAFKGSCIALSCLDLNGFIKWFSADMFLLTQGISVYFCFYVFSVDEGSLVQLQPVYNLCQLSGSAGPLLWMVFLRKQVSEPQRCQCFQCDKTNEAKVTLVSESRCVYSSTRL